MRRPPIILLLAGLAVATPLAAHAQVDPFKGSRQAGLTSSDFRVMNDAAKKLAAQNPADGTSQPWTNPRTGASGSVTAGGAFHHKGLACRKVNYSGKKSDQSPESTIELGWCRTASGWKML